MWLWNLRMSTTPGLDIVSATTAGSSVPLAMPSPQAQAAFIDGAIEIIEATQGLALSSLLLP